MDLMKIGTKLLMSKMMGGNSGMATAALGKLIGSGSSLDLGSIISKMQGGGDSGLAGLAASWIGKGKNDAISSDQLRGLLGKDKITQFASEMGVDESTAISGLKETLPNMVDQASPDGSLLDSIGGLGGLMNMASKFMK